MTKTNDFTGTAVIIVVVDTSATTVKEHLDLDFTFQWFNERRQVTYSCCIIRLITDKSLHEIRKCIISSFINTRLIPLYY